MFELGREFMRLFAGERIRPFADGLTGGDATLLELLDLKLLQQEAKSADVAAGRISAQDKAQRRLDAAVVWREVARRSGDAVALRKAAAAAETACAAFDPVRRPDAWARARCEQGFCGLAGRRAVRRSRPRRRGRGHLPRSPRRRPRRPRRRRWPTSAWPLVEARERAWRGRRRTPPGPPSPASTRPSRRSTP